MKAIKEYKEEIAKSIDSEEKNEHILENENDVRFIKVKESRRRRNKIKNKGRKKKKLFILNVIVLLIVATLVVIFLNLKYHYPWGSDTYGHLYKGEILYDALRSGDFFLNYDPNWYNGVQPFRYWAPMPYYLLALINFLTNNIFITWNLFIGVVFFIGGFGFLLWGYYLNRQVLGLFVGVLWFFVPNNLRILFSEGNIPYALVNALLPLTWFLYYKGLIENKKRNYIGLALLMSIITLNHAMLAAMVGISMFIYSFVNAIVTKEYKKNIFMLVVAFLGIMISGFWLLPGLKGGLMGIDSSAVSEVMKEQSYPFSVSLNPVIRFGDIERYYFGLSFALVILFAILFSRKKEITGFIAALVILIGTNPLLLPIISKLPLNQLFWMIRFTSIAMCFILFSILLWKRLRASVLLFLMIIIIADSAISFKVLGKNREFPSTAKTEIEVAKSIGTERIGVFDTSRFGSFPSYYITYGDEISKDTVKKQSYGWAWQGATTAPNIVAINDALENEYYLLAFDRALELGSDTVIVAKNLVKDFNKLDEEANRVGYYLNFEASHGYVYKYPFKGQFGLRSEFKGLAIGKYSSNIINIFPNFAVGNSNNIEDYSLEELKKYETVYLSGFKYKSKKKAEELLRALSKSGVKVVVDLVSIEDEFLNITPQPIMIKDNYGEFLYNGEKFEFENFPKGQESFSTNFISNTKEGALLDSIYINNRKIDYHYKENENLSILALNLPYFAKVTGDGDAIKILEDIFKQRAFTLPSRELVEVDIEIKGDREIIIRGEGGTITSLASIDGFKAVNGEFSSFNNLVKLENDGEVIIEIGYPLLRVGIIVSIISIVLLAILCRSSSKIFNENLEGKITNKKIIYN